MHWNEKINLIKNQFSKDEFFVLHVGRKEILRKIENRFITRPKDYYDLNNLNSRFCNWGGNTKPTFHFHTISDYQGLLKLMLLPNKTYWIAFEFSDEILIYKAKPNAIYQLCTIGQNLTKTFHLIDLKFENMMSFDLSKTDSNFKFYGNELFIKRVQKFLT